MQRYYQTMARVMAGLVTLAMLAWFLWPRGSALLDREEALFAFLIALCYWIMTEIKESDEVIYRAASKNDIRLARHLISYSSDKFRTLFKEHDFHSGISSQYFSELHGLLNEYDAGTTFFQDRHLQPLFKDFCHTAELFSNYMVEHSAPNEYGNNSIIPREFHGDRTRFANEIKTANRLSTQAWQALLPLVKKIRERVPEAFDEPITYEWFRSEHIYRKGENRKKTEHF